MIAATRLCPRSASHMHGVAMLGIDGPLREEGGVEELMDTRSSGSGPESSPHRSSAGAIQRSGHDPGETAGGVAGISSSAFSPVRVNRLSAGRGFSKLST
jgi:hypothetical protein